MKKTKGTLKRKYTKKQVDLYISFELSQNNWKLGFSDGNKMRYRDVEARNLEKLQEEIELAKKIFKLKKKIRIVSCYEAGRDGFWLHRYLLNCGIENIVVDSSSIEVSRRKRRAKTDRIDVKKLLMMLMRHHGGEKKIWSVVNVPSEKAEDERNLNRELDSLDNERTRHRNRIRGFLIQHGLEVKSLNEKKFLKELESLRTWDGKELPKDLKARIIREFERLTMVEGQKKLLKKEREHRVNLATTSSLKKVAQLRTLKGIGNTSSWDFVMEMFGWRKFKNPKQVGGFAGLTPTPYDSGNSQREQGISKAGRGRIRALSIQIAWGWLRYQPKSKLSLWFAERFANGGSRMRRIGIVAVARKLLIDLWRYLEYGAIPEGAQLKPTK